MKLANISILPAEVFPQDTGSNPIGQVCLANEARFDSRYYSEPLTTYLTGYRDPSNLQELIDFIAPPVQVARRFEFKAAVNAEEFLSETDDVRAINADFKRVEYTGTTTNSKTLNKGLTLRLDRDELAGNPMLRELAIRRLQQRILRNEARRAVTVLLNGATNTAKTWDGSAGKDPDQDILTDLTTGADTLGFMCNRVLFGQVAWNKRILSHRAQATAGGFASAAKTPQEVAGWLGIDEVRISKERYQSSASAKTKVTADVVCEFFADPVASTEDSSHCKRFWSPCDGGGMFGVYEMPVGVKFIDITVEHYSIVVAPHTNGLRKLTIS